MKAVLVLSVLLAATLGVSTAAAEHVCPGDAPYLPGAISQYYDMWNNIYRHYTCGHPWDILFELDIAKKVGSEGVAFRAVLP